MNKEYVSTQELCNILDISYPTLMRRKKNSEIFPKPVRKENKSKLY